MIYELRGLIYGKFDSQKKCADALGWTRQQINAICLGKREATVGEVYQLAEILECDPRIIAEMLHRYHTNLKRA